MTAQAEEETCIALDELAVALETAARAYANGAESEGNAELSSLFADMAADRRHEAAHLRDTILLLGSLPDEPDPERIAVGALWQSLRRALSPDEQRVLIEDALRHEDAVAEAVARARGRLVPDDTSERLRRCADRADDNRRKLRSIRDAMQ